MRRCAQFLNSQRGEKLGDRHGWGDAAGRGGVRHELRNQCQRGASCRRWQNSLFNSFGRFHKQLGSVASDGNPWEILL